MLPKSRPFNPFMLLGKMSLTICPDETVVSLALIKVAVVVLAANLIVPTLTLLTCRSMSVVDPGALPVVSTIPFGIEAGMTQVGTQANSRKVLGSERPSVSLSNPNPHGTPFG
jgi:hypothetical protein